MGAAIPCVGIVAGLAGFKLPSMMNRLKKSRKETRIQRRLQDISAFPTRHNFYFVNANKLRAWTGEALPHHQVLRKWEGWLSQITLDLKEDRIDRLGRKFLVLSHRWFT